MRVLTYINGVIHIIIIAATLSILIPAMYIFKKSKYKAIKIWCNFERIVLGMKLDFQGTLQEDTQILLLNHQSMLDILALEISTKRHLAWVSKEEITNMFWFGHINKAPNQISIKRGQIDTFGYLLKEVKKRLDENRIVCIFPEGTRTRGVKMRGFKKGSKLLCEKLKLKIQPCVVIGTNHVFDSKKLVHTPGRARVVFLPQIDLSKGEQDKNWYENIHTDMQKELDKGIKEFGYS